MSGDPVIRILFVEDLPSDVMLAERGLTKSGLVFKSECVDTEKALSEALRVFKPDVVVSDYAMPAFDGMAALRVVKLFDPHLPFIVLTGSINEETAVECLKAGANDYVTKEHKSRLVYAIREAIEQKILFTKAQEQETRLRESEERYHSIFAGSNAVMLIVNPVDSMIIDLNEAAVAFYGWTREELLEKKIFDLNTLPPEVVKEQVRRSILKEKNHVQFKHRRADGSLCDVESHAGPITIGNTTYLLSIIHDISERVVAQKERDLIAEKLSHYLLMSPTITYSLQLGGGIAHIVWVSENIESILGYTVEEARKVEWWYSNVLSTDREVAAKGIPTLIERKSYTHEYRFTCKDRKVIWIRDEMRLIEGDGGSAEIVGTLTDITAHKLVEDEIKLKSAALEALDTAVVITDRDANIEWANHGFEALTGYSAAEALGKNPKHLLKSGSQDPRLYTALWDTILSGKTWRGEIVNMKKSGILYNEEMIITPVMNYARRIEHFIAIKNDVSEKTRSREKLESSLREKEVLLREIHHRVKNNMQVISSLVNLSSDKVSDQATQELIEELRRRIDVMSIVHEQFYAASDVSRIDFALYLTQVVSNLMEDYRIKPGMVEVRQHTIPLLLDLDAAIPAGLIVSELISNALKVLVRQDHARGILAISIDHDARETATIIIEDNGPGLPPGFDPKAVSTLGFRLIEILAQQLHGSISFISASGTKAILRFPHSALI